MPKKKEPKHHFSEEIETALKKKIVDSEYTTAKANKSDDNMEFEACLSLLSSTRVDKNYDWMSNIRVPEFVSEEFTQRSLDVGQYFQTRDFVEVYLEDEGDEAKANAEATKELINRTLNQRHLYHYLKFTRSKSLTNVVGECYAECRWEQRTIEGQVGTETIATDLDVDVYGNEIVDRNIQEPAQEITEEPVMGQIPIVDRFQYDILDNRNVFCSSEYTYSLQDKDWIIIRAEKSLDKLKTEAPQAGYFNWICWKIYEHPGIPKLPVRLRTKIRAKTFRIIWISNISIS